MGILQKFVGFGYLSWDGSPHFKVYWAPAQRVNRNHYKKLIGDKIQTKDLQVLGQICFHWATAIFPREECKFVLFKKSCQTMDHNGRNLQLESLSEADHDKKI